MYFQQVCAKGIPEVSKRSKNTEIPSVYIGSDKSDKSDKLKNGYPLPSFQKKIYFVINII